MARDGSGTYSLPATMAVASSTASSTTVNTIMNDVAQALTDSINKDGTKAFAANQSMGSNKITSLTAGTAATDAANVSQVQSGKVMQATTVGGTADAITLAFSPAITAYTTGMKIRWVSGGANTIAGATVNCDSAGLKTLKKNPGAAALLVGDLGASGTIHEAVYDGTYFVVQNPVTAQASTTEVLTGTDALKLVTPDALAALWEQGADVASAGTISLGEGGYFNITGTTTITDIDFATDKAGRKAWVKFAGALTLTHNATTLILPNGANIITAAGDTAEFVSEGSDAVRCVSYQRAALPAFRVKLSAPQTVTANVETKVQSNTEDYDTASCYDNATNYRFTPTVSGYYMFTHQVSGKGTTTLTKIYTVVAKNGATFYYSGEINSSLTNNVNSCVSGSVIIYLNGSTDYVEHYGLVNGTGTMTFEATSGMSGCFLRS